MLVLARRLHERIIIPSIRTAIEVTAVRPGFVRLGIDAPPEVIVLREEVYRREPAAAAGPETGLARAQQGWRHRLNNLTLGLALMRQQLPAGAAPDLEGTLGRMEEEIRGLCRELQAVFENGQPAAAAEACTPTLTVAAPAGDA